MNAAPASAAAELEPRADTGNGPLQVGGEFIEASAGSYVIKPRTKSSLASAARRLKQALLQTTRVRSLCLACRTRSVPAEAAPRRMACR